MKESLREQVFAFPKKQNNIEFLFEHEFNHYLSNYFKLAQDSSFNKMYSSLKDHEIFPMLGSKAMTDKNEFIAIYWVCIDLI